MNGRIQFSLLFLFINWLANSLLNLLYLFFYSLMNLRIHYPVFLNSFTKIIEESLRKHIMKLEQLQSLRSFYVRRTLPWPFWEEPLVCFNVPNPSVRGSIFIQHTNKPKLPLELQPCPMDNWRWPYFCSLVDTCLVSIFEFDCPSALVSFASRP